MLALFGLDNLLLSGGRDNVIRCTLHPEACEFPEADSADNHAGCVFFPKRALAVWHGTGTAGQGTGWNWDVRG